MLADEPKDAALLSAGFAVGAGEYRAIREKALRSQAWKDVDMRLNILCAVFNNAGAGS